MILFLLSFLLAAPLDEKSVCERASHHLLLSNPRVALDEVTTALKDNPHSQKLLATKISILAALQDEGAMLATWTQYHTLFPKAVDDTLLEKMAWATIKKGTSNSSSLIRMEASLAAFYSQDAQGIPLLEKLLDDHNMGLRLFGLYLVSHLRDEIFEKKVLALLISDESIPIQLAAIDALGHMRSEHAYPYLITLLEKETTSSEMRFSILQAICQIRSKIERNDLITLTKSSRAFLRILACEFVLKHTMTDSIDLILPLILDNSKDVQIAAMQTLGALRPKLPPELIVSLKEIAQDESAELAISANYLLLTTDSASEITQKRFAHFLSHHNQETRLLAAAACAHSGSKGVAIAAKALQITDDPLVAINLAILIITQRDERNLPQAIGAIEQGLQTIKGRLDFSVQGLFTFIHIGTDSHLASMPRYPEAKDLACRLSLYSVLASCNAPHIEALLASFLKERSWGITGMAANLLIQEGDASALSIIKKLLQDETLEIRVQAAFLLAISTQDEEALSVLENAYAKAPREMKEQILLGIGAIGSKTSLPFLCIALNEASPILRIRASSAILQCLYH
ncbi:MAG: hypothetical protein JWO53_531 [Chlamydiia bacterium]|nr:hypothetical protein [Chlamydiia bacterium]